MKTQAMLMAAAVALAGCVQTDGLMVSDAAEPLGGNLFVETDSEGFQFLVLDGEITPDTAFVFQVLAESEDIPGLLIAQSPGGNLLAAHQIGRTIQREGMDTMVLASCISACVDIFIAGRDRDISPLGELGLHAPEFPEAMYEFDREYWGALGFGAINDAAYRVPNRALWILTPQEAINMGLATSILSDP